MNSQVRDGLERLIAKATGKPFRIDDLEASRGGCIHQTGICSASGRRYFFKLHDVAFLDGFAAQADGLNELAAAGVIRVPEVIGHGLVGDRSCLVLEALELAGPASVAAWERLGRNLAALHRCSSGNHGWWRDNHIGSTRQSNRRHDAWADFFVEERLRPQLQLAASWGHDFGPADPLLERVRERLADHHPVPSLLHGDLWSGNVGFTTEGEPVVFDPAVYYGDREADLAFSEFFGGFSPAFYQAYNREFPLWEGYPGRRDLYNLYHVLNHANLFGDAYVGQARGMIREILSRS